MPLVENIGGVSKRWLNIRENVGGVEKKWIQAWENVGGVAKLIFAGGRAYALLATSIGQTTLYSIDVADGVLTQVGSEQTISGVSTISGIGTFTVGSTAYVLLETGTSSIGQTTLYSIDVTDGVLTQVGSEQTISGVSAISGIGTFTVGSTAYALMETGPTTGQTTLYSIDVTDGVLTQVGSEQTISGVGTIGGIGTFTVGSTAYVLLETGTSSIGQTTLYSIDVTDGVLTQVGSEQTISGVSAISGIGTFTVGSTAYALMETGPTSSGQTTLYSIDVTDGVLTQVGTEQTLSGISNLFGIGTFVA